MSKRTKLKLGAGIQCTCGSIVPLVHFGAHLKGRHSANLARRTTFRKRAK